MIGEGETFNKKAKKGLLGKRPRTRKKDSSVAPGSTGSLSMNQHHSPSLSSEEHTHDTSPSLTSKRRRASPTLMSNSAVGADSSTSTTPEDDEHVIGDDVRTGSEDCNEWDDSGERQAGSREAPPISSIPEELISKEKCVDFDPDMVDSEPLPCWLLLKKEQHDKNHRKMIEEWEQRVSADYNPRYRRARAIIKRTKPRKVAPGVRQGGTFQPSKKPKEKNQRFLIQWYRGCAVGKYGNLLTNYIGALVKRPEVFNVAFNFPYQPFASLVTVWNELKRWFDLSGNPRACVYVYYKLQKDLKDWRAYLKTFWTEMVSEGAEEWKLFHATDKRADRAQLAALVFRWETTKDQVRAEKNKKNRSKLDMNHHAGSSSFAAAEFKKGLQLGRPLNPAERFEVTHMPKKSDYLSDANHSEAIKKKAETHSKLTEAVDKVIAESETPVVTAEKDLEINREIFGDDPKYRTRFAGPRVTIEEFYGVSSEPSGCCIYSQSSRLESRELESLREEVKQGKEERDMLTANLEGLQAKLNSLQNIVEQCVRPSQMNSFGSQPYQCHGQTAAIRDLSGNRSQDISPGRFGNEQFIGNSSNLRDFWRA